MSGEQGQQGEGSSQVRMLLDSIEIETQAMFQIVNGFRVTAPHKIIEHQHNIIGHYTEELSKIVGEEKANNMMTKKYNEVVEKYKE